MWGTDARSGHQSFVRGEAVYEGSWVVVKRDIEAITVPYGTKMNLPSGTQVRVAQAIGGNYTVVTDLGVMCRIEAQDADAIGETHVKAEAQAVDLNAPFDEKNVWAQMRTVFDPEIPINIVDLGLVYECQARALAEGGHRVEIKMTMTAPGCGMGEVLKRDVEQKVARVAGVKEVHVDVVFEPQWNLGMMSEAARLQLGL
jgi:probable FeS assembly SUF system protein SufT